MAEAVASISPDEIDKNPDNPRLIFHAKDLEELEASIAAQGILVPLTVYRDGDGYIILDGERRWRSARKLGLRTVPAIIYPKPPRMRNIMMMFAIHNARTDWDPLPTALKLRQLEELYEKDNKRRPNESELAQLASLSRGEVRRLKNILALPEKHLAVLRDEAEKPRADQTITVDHLLEVTRAAWLLRKRDVVDDNGESALVDALVTKFRAKVLTSTVEPRLLTKLASAVERNEVPRAEATRTVRRLVDDPSYTVKMAYSDSIERVDFEHSVDLSATRLAEKLREPLASRSFGEAAESALRELQRALNEYFARG